MASAFNVLTGVFETIDSIDSAGKYAEQRPHSKPYQSLSHKQRFLFVHTTSGYIVWKAGKKDLMLRTSEFDSQRGLTGYEHLGDTERLVRFGDFIHSCKTDEAEYRRAKKTYMDAKQKPVTGKRGEPEPATVAQEGASSVPIPASSTSSLSDPSGRAAVTTVRAADVASHVKGDGRSTSFYASVPNADTAAVDAFASSFVAAAAAATTHRPTIASGAGTAPPLPSPVPAAPPATSPESSDTERVARPETAVSARDGAPGMEDDQNGRAHRWDEFKKIIVEPLIVKHSLTPDEAEALKMQFDGAKSLIFDNKKTPKTVYEEIINDAISCLKKGCEKAAKESLKIETVYQYRNDQGGWEDVVNSKAIDALSQLSKEAPAATINIRGNNYALTFVPGAVPTYTQTNTSTNKVREVRRIEREPILRNGISNKQRNEMLFGDAPWLDLLKEKVEHWKSQDYDSSAPEYFVSRDLSELAQMFGSLSSPAYRYMVPKGTRGTKQSSTHQISNTDGTHDFNCQVWVKGSNLRTFLEHASSRGYRHARIGCHGAGKTQDGKLIYDIIRDSSTGLNLEHAGTQGQAYGPGIYLGLSAAPTIQYNRNSKYPNGTYVMCLVLSRDREGWKKHREATLGCSHTYMGPYGTNIMKDYSLVDNSFDSNYPNIMVVHDTPLVLCLGLAHSFDEEYGWMMPP